MRSIAVVVGLAAALAGCAGASGASGQAQQAADATTKAVYNDDYAAVTQNFNTNLKAQVHRDQVGLLSDKLQALGAYKGVTFVGSDTVKNEFTYKANFSKGDTTVVVRLDPSGPIAAYRVLMPKE